MQIYGEDTSESVVSLARYAQIIGYTECSFFGVSHPANIQFACRELWTLQQRLDIQSYLLSAQNDLEQQLGFPIGKKWFSDERHKLRPLLLTKWARVIDIGVQVIAEIEDDAVVDLTTIADYGRIVIDPFTDISDHSEIHVFYPDQDQEIVPSSITVSGTTLTILIPRCRLVKFTLLDNPEEGLVYSDDANFQTTADVKRVYTDPSTRGELVYRDVVTSFSQELTEATSLYLEDPNIGKIVPELDIRTCGKNFSHIKINYSAGISVTHEIENIIVRLAHSKMATEPCGCDITQRLWARDRNVPQVLTRERVNCPFGMSDGAWNAWRWASSHKALRMSTILGDVYG